MLEVGELRTDRLGHRHAVGPRLLVDVEQHGVLTIGGDAHPLRHDALADRRDVAEADLCRAVGRNHHVAEFVELRDRGIGNHKIQFVVVLDAARGHQHVARTDRSRHIRKRQLVGSEARRIDRDLQFVLRTTGHFDARYTLHG